MAPALTWPADLLGPLKQANIYLQSHQEGLAIPLLKQVRAQVTDTRLQQEISHRLLRALIKTGHLDEARSDMASAVASWGGDQPDWVESMAWRINPHWWTPCQGSGVRIRRAQGTDAQWLKDTFAQGCFGSAVNRDYSLRMLSTPTAQVANQLSRQQALPPPDVGALLMVIEGAQEQALGIASLVNIDEPSRRAEFIIGFPGNVPHGVLVLETGTLLAQLAFAKLHFHKITASIYGDNPRLSDLTTMLSRIGFVQEGLQREHVKGLDGTYADVHLWGGLRTSVLQCRLMQRCALRFLDQTMASPLPGSPP